MNLARKNFVRSAASNAAFFTIAAAVFIAFSIYYTRAFGVERYGEFSFLLNTVTALIALGAYEGFLLTHSVAQTRDGFERFNSRFAYFNAGLVAVTALAFVAVSGILNWLVVAPVLLALYLDYRSQSSLAVLTINDDNWKIRAFRTAYQVILVVAFCALQMTGYAIDQSFAAAVAAASITNYVLLVRAAKSNLARPPQQPAEMPEIGFNVLLIAVATNLATVLFLLLDKIAVHWFDIGTADEVGLYFLFFDLATRAEALFLLLAVPVTNHLFNKTRTGPLPSGDIVWMILGCLVAGLLCGGLGFLLVPLVYDVSLAGLAALPWIFGFYVTARGIRYVLKALCNATGLHWTLLASNYLVLVAGCAALCIALWIGGGALSVLTLAAILAVAHIFRLPVLIKVLVSGSGIRETLVPVKP